MTANPILQVKDLTVTLGGHTIIDNISFSVDEGTTCAIIGPNGAGKSVLIKAILRLLPKEKGEVTIFDTPHEKYRKVAHQISYIPQTTDFDRNFPLTVHGLFALKSKRPFGLSATDEARAQALLKLVDMQPHLHKKLGDLSGGQLQRVLLAYSLMDKPRLLILDEPSAGIDTKGQETMYALLHRIKEAEKLTMILISHELDVVMQYADQVLCLNKELLCAGLPNEVLTADILKEMYGMPVRHFHHTHDSR